MERRSARANLDPGRVLLMVLILSAVLLPLRPAEAASLPTLVRAALQQRDLPADYLRSYQAVTNNAQAARDNGVDVSVINELGRVLGYDVGYSHPGRRGVCCVYNDVVEFTSPAAATRGYHFFLARDRNTYRTASAYGKTVSRSRNFVEFTFQCLCSGYRQTVDLAETRVGKYYVSVELHFFDGTEPLGLMRRQAVSYLDIVENRLRKGV